MLENHFYYEDIALNKDNKIELPECCTKLPPDESGCPDCCYDDWKTELRHVNQRYNKEREAAEMAQKQIDFITDRKNRYKKWYDEIEYSEELSRTLCGQLEVILSQTQKIWLTTCHANKAIQKLFCMIRDFFLEVDYLKCRFDELWACITTSSDAVLQEEKGIRLCLKNLGITLDAVIKTREDLLKLMVDAIRFSQLLHNNISTACCPEKEPDCKDLQKPTADKGAYGFKSITWRWYKVLGCDVDCSKPTDSQGQTKDAYNQNARSTQAAQTDQDSNAAAQPTYERCELEPLFTLPFCKDTYKGEVYGWWDADVKTLTRLSVSISDLNKKKEGLLACKASLTAALAATNPKDRCK